MYLISIQNQTQLHECLKHENNLKIGSTFTTGDALLMTKILAGIVKAESAAGNDTLLDWINSIDDVERSPQPDPNTEYASVAEYLANHIGLSADKVEQRLRNQAVLTIREADPKNEAIRLHIIDGDDFDETDYSMTCENLRYLGVGEFTLYPGSDFKVRYYDLNGTRYSATYQLETYDSESGQLVDVEDCTINCEVLMVMTITANIRGVATEVVQNIYGYSYGLGWFKDHRRSYGHPVDEETYQLDPEIQAWLESPGEYRSLGEHIVADLQSIPNDDDDLPF